MPLLKPVSSGWRGVCLIAITYVYFLIFAQFAFLKRLALLWIADDHLKAAMAAMAFGGILFSLLVPRVARFPSPALRLRAGLAACGAAAAMSLPTLNLPGTIAVSFLIGCGLGLLTVTLVTYLRLWIGSTNPLLKVGLGTGIGYLVCNLPPLFTASPETQAAISALLCIGGICLTFQRSGKLIPATAPPAASGIPFLQALACFTALIWLDSAAFFIIQNTPALKAGTWGSDFHLWGNGLLHFGAALAAVALLRRRGLAFLLAIAFLALGAACLLLLDPNRALPASGFYPVGVSLYSVALVAYPSLLARATSDAQRGRQAGWIYAIAGWFGSAMGIGMGQNLGHVPPVFVVAAGAVVLLPAVIGVVRFRRRELGAVAMVLTAAWGIYGATVASHAAGPLLSAVERGRQVYIAEGCISCHSQYVRPNTPDVAIWGPVESVAEIRHENPPLIGNRRQGPDLAQVGNRRSALWLKAHFYDPSELSHNSFMPSYRHLFEDRRGDDLVQYLRSLQTGDRPEETTAGSAQVDTSPSGGERLFESYCATCHSPAGLTRTRWHAAFRRFPPDLKAGPFLHISASESFAGRRAKLARVVKFGIPGTDMPGHEYLPDETIASLSIWLAQNVAP